MRGSPRHCRSAIPGIECGMLLLEAQTFTSVNRGQDLFVPLRGIQTKASSMDQLFQEFWDDIGEAATLSGGDVLLPKEEGVRAGCSTAVKVGPATFALCRVCFHRPFVVSQPAVASAERPRDSTAREASRTVPPDRGMACN